MSHKITLRPDSNRRRLESMVGKQVEDGVLPDSLTHVVLDKSEAPRVLFMIPYYTWIKRPVEICKQMIETRAWPA